MVSQGGGGYVCGYGALGNRLSGWIWCPRGKGDMCVAMAPCVTDWVGGYGAPGGLWLVAGWGWGWIVSWRVGWVGGYSTSLGRDVCVRGYGAPGNGVSEYGAPDEERGMYVDMVSPGSWVCWWIWCPWEWYLELVDVVPRGRGVGEWVDLVPEEGGWWVWVRHLITTSALHM